MSCIHANLKGTFIKNSHGDYFYYFDTQEFLDCFGDLSLCDVFIDLPQRMVYFTCYGEAIGAALDIYQYIEAYHLLDIDEQMLIADLANYPITYVEYLFDN